TSAALLQALAIDPKQRFPDCASFVKAVMHADPAPPPPAPVPATVPTPAPTESSTSSSPISSVNQVGMTRVTCPACLKVLKLPITAKKVKCGACSQVFRMPGSGESVVNSGSIPPDMTAGRDVPLSASGFPAAPTGMVPAERSPLSCPLPPPEKEEIDGT